MPVSWNALARGRQVAVVAARFNEEVTTKLLEGCLARLRAAGVPEAAIHVARVPGAFEIPLAAKWLAQSGRYAAIVCLGALIRGDTPHFDYISQAASRGIMETTLATGVPLAFGILTCDTEAQALARVDAKSEFGHKGAEAAEAALAMVELRDQIFPPALPAG
jgi:6,7-dimethyl-8-ribityllumazine synthase